MQVDSSEDAYSAYELVIKTEQQQPSFGILNTLPFRPTDFFAFLLLASGLILPPLASYEAVYVTLGIALIFTIPILAKDRTALFLPGLNYVIAALAMMIVATLMIKPVASDWVGPGIIALCLLSAGVLGASAMAPRIYTPVLIAWFCLIGAIAGAGSGVLEVLAGVGRAGVGNNPIHYSGLVVVLGFCALAGAISTKSFWRYIFLLGPVSAFTAALVSGSRGPLLAALVLSVIAWTILMIWNRKSRVFWLSSFVFGLAGISLLAVSAEGTRALAGLLGFLTGENVGTAGSDELRRTLYLGGVRAFLDSPLWGHGFSNLMAAASQYMPAENRYTRYDHLHNDIIDFLVVGGILGGLSYLALLAAPLTVLRHIRRVEARGTILMAGMLSGSYALLGLTNAMIGVLPQTVLFMVLLGCVFVLDKQLGV